MPANRKKERLLQRTAPGVFIIGRIKNQNKVTHGELTFDSQMEKEFYLLLSKNPNVKHIELQPNFVLQPTFKKSGETIRSITYKADFLIEWKNGMETVVDVKGHETEVFKLKNKLFEYQYRDKRLEVVKGKYNRKYKYYEFPPIGELIHA